MNYIFCLQERRAYLFCQEDRAILCRECDLPIHRANEHTQNHNRFLLTGVKLSGTSFDPSASSPINGTDRVMSGLETRSSRPKLNRHRSVSNENASSSCKVEDNVASDTGSVSTSSISEYLTETIPGYCFEDLLDASFAPNNANGFCKVCYISKRMRTGDLLFFFLGFNNNYGWCLLFLNNYIYDHHSTFQDQDLEVSTCLFPLVTWVPKAQVQST